MKKSVLIKLSYIVEVPDEKLDDIESYIDEITSMISSDSIIKLREGKTIQADWQSTRTVELDKDVNCGQCYNCGCWTTDLDRDFPVPELSAGAKVHEKLLCDVCLPKDHKYAF